MTPERWKRTEEVYHAAHALAPQDRAAFLTKACGDDEAMRRDIESLLKEALLDEGFLSRPALVLPAPDAPRPALGALAGHSVGVYRFDTLLGAGGMGDVYRAHDSKLGRDVAIKILPPTFTSDPDRLARFEREARLLAALNHPGICAIYGLEEINGIRFLVLELVEGETLAHKLPSGVSPASRGAGLPLDDSLTIARQIVDALEFAHERGIVHRDLKPANVIVTPDGGVKLLDFGLAKAVRSEDSGSNDLTVGPKGTRVGVVMGTPTYMSPEQARGLSVDKRTDIWAFGCVVYEMLSGRIAFPGDTASDSIAKILEREPEWSALPATTPAPIRRLLVRCLAKDPRKRLRDIGDARIELDAINDARLSGATDDAVPPPVASRTKWLPWAAVATLAAAVVLWEANRPVSPQNPLPSEGFELLTDWPGSEGSADISPDGKVVAFVADRDGELDLFTSQIGSGVFENLTEAFAPLNQVVILRSPGFSGDSSRVWSALVPRQKVEFPWSGGEPRPFLVEGAQTPAWSSDDRLVYFNNQQSDALWAADSEGRNAQKMVVDWPAGAGPDVAPHTHNMVWSPDNQWIYFVHGIVRDWNHGTDEMDIWRIRPSGGTPERLTYLNTAVTFLAMLDQDTLAFIAPEEDGFGSWLWSLDVGGQGSGWLGTDRATPRRIPTGTQQFTSVSASRDRGPLVATQANPTASLWRVPILTDRLATENDVQPFPVQTKRALAPRFARRAPAPLLFYLSARGTGDRVWGFTTSPFEVTRGADGHVSETPAPSPDGSQVGVIVKKAGRRNLAVMNQSGQGSQILAASVDIQGAVDWSPDGKWIAAGGLQDGEAGLFAIPVDGGAPRRLVSGRATDPIWSPGGAFVAYATTFAGGGAGRPQAGAPLKAVRLDGTEHDLPRAVGPVPAQEDLLVSPGGFRFVDETHLVYRPVPESFDFWLFDLTTGKAQQITHLTNKGSLRGFDVTPDGTHIVFDRAQQNSDIVLINLPRR